MALLCVRLQNVKKIIIMATRFLEKGGKNDGD